MATRDLDAEILHRALLSPRRWRPALRWRWNDFRLRVAPPDDWFDRLCLSMRVGMEKLCVLAGVVNADLAKISAALEDL